MKIQSALQLRVADGKDIITFKLRIKHKDNKPNYKNGESYFIKTKRNSFAERRHNKPVQINKVCR